mmetsp:Transcript_17/g.16  ORF Transcript_17/g.16 Transcript_17/m.16 type:complete len:170 (+) Transcript_17:33-542(+)
MESALAAGTAPDEDDEEEGWPVEEAEQTNVPDASASSSSAPVVDAEEVTVPSVHTFIRRHALGNVLIHLTLLEGSAFLWIGDAKLGLEDLQVSVPTPYDPLPSVTTLRGDSEGPGAGMAQKLSRRFKMLIFLSFNLSNTEMQFLMFIQKEIIGILEALLPKVKHAGSAA